MDEDVGQDRIGQADSKERATGCVEGPLEGQTTRPGRGRWLRYTYRTSRGEDRSLMGAEEEQQKQQQQTPVSQEQRRQQQQQQRQRRQPQLRWGNPVQGQDAQRLEAQGRVENKDRTRTGGLVGAGWREKRTRQPLPMERLRETTRGDQRRPRAKLAGPRRILFRAGLEM